jgi:hypothetical protein
MQPKMQQPKPHSKHKQKRQQVPNSLSILVIPLKLHALQKAS